MKRLEALARPRDSVRLFFVLGLVTRPFVVVVALHAAGCQKTEEPRGHASAKAPAALPVAPASYVGSNACKGCHAPAFSAWRRSQHGRAMAAAESEVMAGDFETKELRHFGAVTRFGRNEAGYRVTTEGQAYEVKYTFGVEPLQQYLVATTQGRLQALPFAYDTRPRADGGARWYALQANENVRAGDELHWTGHAYNWNKSCADCHSTDLRKNYDAGAKRYDTRYSEISVGCEACHGPASGHVAQAQGAGFDAAKGLLRAFSQRADWAFVQGKSIAVPSGPTSAKQELDACGPCHSRRSELLGPAGEGSSYHDRYRLEFLSAALYFDDGQIKDEVFELGSFLQSKMHAAGVTCSNCHEPHAGELRASGNALCAQCHRAETYDRTSHHLHPSGSAGAACVECHMPSRTYMGIDARRDHRFGLPRPDLSTKLGVPNACTERCHRDQSNAWASSAIERHFGPKRAKSFAEALHAGRALGAGGDGGLLAIATDAALPALVRATALAELANYPDADTQALVTLRSHESPLLRRALARIAPNVAQRSALSAALLADAVLSVRLEAAQALLELPPQAWSAAERQAFVRVEPELRRSLEYNADRPEALLALARLESLSKREDRAEARYREALELDPTLSAAYIALADQLRSLGRDPEAVALLERGTRRSRDRAPLEHALGLTLVRLGKRAEALEHLEKAHELAPDSVQLGFVYAVALFDSGRRQQAISLLERLQRRFAGDRRVQDALKSYRSQATAH
jgi:predicted CXXCH cytochrome family protein